MFTLSTYLVTLKNLPFIAIGILSIGFIIAFHEFGHFIFARLFGVTVHNFSIGFGPKIFSKYFKGTTFSLSLIPIGGYVEIEPGETSNPALTTLGAQSYWKKMFIIGGGIFCNIFLAYTIFFGIALNGLQENTFFNQEGTYQLHSITEKSPAATAGLIKHDKIVKFNDIDVSHNLQLFLELLGSHPETEVLITIERNNELLTIPVTLGQRLHGSTKIGTLGINKFCFEPLEPTPFFKAFTKAGSLTFNAFKSSLGAFSGALKQKSAENFSGPLMMISVVTHSIKTDPMYFFIILALISIGLAVLNIFPLPILDGGQALTYTIEAIIRRPLPEKFKEYLHYACWIFMMGLFIYLSFKDIIRLYFGS